MTDETPRNYRSEASGPRQSRRPIASPEDAIDPRSAPVDVCDNCGGTGVIRVEREPDGSGGGAVPCRCRSHTTIPSGPDADQPEGTCRASITISIDGVEHQVGVNIEAPTVARDDWPRMLVVVARALTGASSALGDIPPALSCLRDRGEGK